MQSLRHAVSSLLRPDGELMTHYEWAVLGIKTLLTNTDLSGDAQTCADLSNTYICFTERNAMGSVFYFFFHTATSVSFTNSTQNVLRAVPA